MNIIFNDFNEFSPIQNFYCIPFFIQKMYILMKFDIILNFELSNFLSMFKQIFYRQKTSV